ncbi:hypothetical protein PFICI_10975 [Pestalotiopsis fici W106-1]|uniref:Uncharacterized protein n=1 Tax=Pestalotiopsis fici (strain W106-1 / CGMCC3.15140) TaxID=1229662 RepID=W3WW68_PESFW|nr:uncharacterized protein PFICI_10975 [Pestalotiopsis fici W106-1]ETS77101.1 hypothetical protein PFICI_10975 [Pestalotiopsis fici W106-1]
MAEAFGVITGLLGVWQFAEDHFPADETPASNYRVTVGLEGFDANGQTLTNAKGEIETIKTYNVQHELIGSGGGLTVGDGEDDQFGDIKVDQEGNSQSIWTEFFAGDDAICIAAITTTMEEGTKWGWTGDWGYWCGLNWFPSGYRLKNDQGVVDACTWIDKDHSEDLKAAAIGINWSELGATEGQKTPSQSELLKKCGDKMQAWPEDGGKQMLPVNDKKKRSSSVFRRSQRSDDRLIVSRLNHNATEVCDSWSSWGPDFVSEQEGIYCNMETHEAIPLCNADKTVDCFDLNTSHGPAMVRRNGKRSPRNPSQVVTWA